MATLAVAQLAAQLKAMGMLAAERDEGDVPMAMDTTENVVASDVPGSPDWPITPVEVNVLADCQTRYKRGRWTMQNLIPWSIHIRQAAGS